MKVICVNNISQSIFPQKVSTFRGENVCLSCPNECDEFISKKDCSKNKKILYALGVVFVSALGLFLINRAGKGNGKQIEELSDTLINDFKNVNEAKKYFENLGIDTEFRDVTKEHLPLLNRVKNDLAKLKEYGVKFDKPDTLTVSDWSKKSEYDELCRKRGISLEEYKPEYNAFCQGDKEGKNHIFINAKKLNSDAFRHEMGHANHYRGHDSYWEAKGIKNHDFADKQLEILGQDIKIYRDGPVEGAELDNIFHLYLGEGTTKGLIATSNMESRFIYIDKMLEAMQKETGCYAPQKLGEQVAYIFDSLIKGDKNFSDEVMLYYDFAGGARIPGKLFGDKTYDEYIESLYNNPELIQKLRENIKISKL